MADPDTQVPDNRVLCVCYFLIHWNALFLTLLLSHCLHLVMQVFLVISGDKTMSIKRDGDQCFFLDYASYSFTSSGCYSIPVILRQMAEK